MSTAGTERYVAAVGMFDGVHLGHRFVVEQLLEQARILGLQSMLITFGSHPLELLKPQAAPTRLCPVDERCRLLQSLGADHVEVLDFEEIHSLTAEEFLTHLHNRFGVDVLLMGFNNHIGCDRRSAASLGPKCAGVDIILLPPKPSEQAISSSAVRMAIANGRVEAAAELLGRRFTIEGTVTQGRQLGRTIGFPTANIEPSFERAQLPARGVYAVDVLLPDGKRRRGMLNIGSRPTVNGSHDTIEVNIFDFEGDLYGQSLKIEFIKRLRDEKRFAGLDELKAQLERDRHLATLC